MTNEMFKEELVKNGVSPKAAEVIVSKIDAAEIDEIVNAEKDPREALENLKKAIPDFNVEAAMKALEENKAKKTELKDDELSQVAGGYTLFSLGDKKFSITDTIKLFGGSIIPGLPASARYLEGVHVDGEDSSTATKEYFKELGEQGLEFAIASTGMMGKGLTQVVASGAGKAAKQVWGWFKNMW